MCVLPTDATVKGSYVNHVNRLTLDKLGDIKMLRFVMIS